MTLQNVNVVDATLLRDGGQSFRPSCFYSLGNTWDVFLQMADVLAMFGGFGLSVRLERSLVAHGRGEPCPRLTSTFLRPLCWTSLVVARALVCSFAEVQGWQLAHAGGHSLDLAVVVVVFFVRRSSFVQF